MEEVPLKARGEATSSRSGTKSTTSDTISRAEHEQALRDMQARHEAEIQELRSQVEALKAGRTGTGTRAPTPTEQLRANQSSIADKVVANRGAEARVNSYNFLDDRSISAMHRAFGSDQLKDVLYGNSRAALRAKAQEMGVWRSGMSHEDAARAVADAWVAKEGHIDGPASHMDEVLHGGRSGAKGEDETTTKGAGERQPRAERQAQKKSDLRPSYQVPIQGDASKTGNHNYMDPFASLNLRLQHLTYGTSKIRPSLETETHTRLKAAARNWSRNHPEDGQPRSYSKKSDLVDYLARAAVHHDGEINSQEDASRAAAREPLKNTYYDWRGVETVNGIPVDGGGGG
jgi:hypothetical protein